MGDDAVGARMRDCGAGGDICEAEDVICAFSGDESRSEKEFLKCGGSAEKVYRRDQRSYAEFYGHDVRTIKRWVKTGRTATGGSDLPPLDEPAKMAEWWSRHYRHRVPPGIRDAAARDAAEKGQDRTTEAVEEPPPPAVAVVGGTGYEHLLQRMRVAEAEVAAQWESARVANDEGRMAELGRRWRDLAKQLRELERDAETILEKSGQSVRKVEVSKELASIHATIVNGMRGVWRKIRLRIEAAGTEQQKDRIFQEEVDRVCARLVETGFGTCE
jgi:hypothetical protein